MIKIAPSILAADFANLERDVRRAAAADYLHVDVMDGLFVPNISIGVPVVECVRKVTALPLDVHLMIDRPVRYAMRFCQAGADIVTVHVEADSAENIREALNIVHGQGKRAGVVLKPGTPAEAALPFLEVCDIVLVMTVEPGFGGQKFMADMMPKLRQLRSWIDRDNPACELEVDGGIDPVTCRTAIENGASVLVAGSSVYKADDISRRIQELRGQDGGPFAL
ncbi:MAG: ribulose-phosphate 3-epimerase [Oscillibacter sp.]|nr:ribulose-phosphate 3-epimerase [Oscillibacter sp.]